MAIKRDKILKASHEQRGERPFRWNQHSGLVKHELSEKPIIEEKPGCIRGSWMQSLSNQNAKEEAAIHLPHLSLKRHHTPHSRLETHQLELSDPGNSMLQPIRCKDTVKVDELMMEDHDSFSWLNLNQRCFKQNLNESFGFQNMGEEADNFEVF